jgi:ATP-dependent Clp protease protease subunit
MEKRMTTSSAKPSGRASTVADRQLLRSRSILLFGPIEPKLTQDIFTRLLVLDQMSKTKPITMYINSPGGVADDGFAIYDLMRFVKAPITTVVTGLAASAATIVMVGTPIEQRCILPHSRVMLHQPSSGVQGTAADIAISAREIIRLRKKANELFVRETGQSLERLVDDMHRDYWMSAEETIDYGLIGKIVESIDDVPQ